MLLSCVFYFYFVFPSIILTFFCFCFISDILSTAINTTAKQTIRIHTSMTHGIKMTVQMYPFNLGYCQQEKIYAKMDLIADPNNSLRDIDKTRCCLLIKPFRNHGYNYVRGMLTVYFRL